MSLKEFSIRLFELGVYHTLEDENYIQTLKVDDGELTSEEAHALHALITDENSPKTAIIALRILAKETNVNPIQVGNICVFKDFRD